MDTGMMKLSVLLLLPLLALSSASPLDVWDNAKQRNDLNGSAEITANRSTLPDPPLRTVAKLKQKRQIQSSSLVSDDASVLEWVTWNNSLPNDAVSINNEYVGRSDYVCKSKCQAGFYTPTKGPYCYYTNAKKEYSDKSFEILVNKDNFEMLEWKKGSFGSMPQNSVRTCTGEDIYVGKNKYGLGKVCPHDRAFYLPWDDSEYWYWFYQVLTISENIISHHIDDVRYNLTESKNVSYPPEIVHETTITNLKCHPVTKTVTLSKTYQEEHKWDFTFSITGGVKTSFRVGMPVITDTGVEVSTEVMLQYSKGNTVIETITDTISVEVKAPPNHSCTVIMVRRKTKLDIPFTARIRRTYGTGEVRTTSISGTYDSVQVANVQAKVERCEPLINPKPCA